MLKEQTQFTETHQKIGKLEKQKRYLLDARAFFNAPPPGCEESYFKVRIILDFGN